MHVLVTRPKDDGLAMQAALSRQGVQSSLAPLLDIRYETLDAIDLSGTQAVAITSRNALKSLVQNKLVSKLAACPVYCVGASTSEFAQSQGLKPVQPSHGTAQALVDQIVAMCDPSHGNIHHIRGTHLALDVRAALEREHFVVRETIAYHAEPVATLPDTAVAALQASEIDGVILMSARSAQSFARLIKQHNITSCAETLHYFCLSPLVGDRLSTELPNIKETAISAPAHPHTEELLALVTRFAANYCQKR